MTKTTTSSKQLMRILATPARVASTLDWKKSIGNATIATLDIHADRIGVRISQHPKQSARQHPSSSLGHDPLPPQASKYHSFPVSPKGWSKIPTATRRGLSDLIHRYGVCGFVVSWPIQEDTGRMGAACGRTLFAIEELLRDHHDGGDEPQSNHNYDNEKPSEGRPVFVPSRPLCLWMDRNQRMPATADAFGRSPSYARITSERTKPIVAASGREPPPPNEPSVASLSRVWDDFARAHWPDLDCEGRKHHRL